MKDLILVVFEYAQRILIINNDYYEAGIIGLFMNLIKNF